MSEITPANNNDLMVVVDRPLDQNPAAAYLAGLSPVGRKGIHTALDLMASMMTGMDALSFPWERLRFQHTSAIRARLSEKYSVSTVNHALSALRSVLKVAWKMGYISTDDYYRAVSVENVAGSTIPAGRGLTQGEITALMLACQNDNTPAGQRDAAIIALMYSGGLRRNEVVRITLTDYDPETGKLLVHGKGSKERLVYLTNGALDAVNDWLAVRGPDGTPLFCAINKGGKINTSKAAASQAIYDLLVKRAEEAQVKAFSPHDLRRTFISDLLDAGADINTVSKLAGHASVTTTGRYDRRPEEAKKKAANLLHVPYTKKGQAK